MRGSSGLRARELIGYVPQDVALYPDLTARENLRFFGRMYRLRGARLVARVDEVLSLVDLAQLAVLGTFATARLSIASIRLGRRLTARASGTSGVRTGPVFPAVSGYRGRA